MEKKREAKKENYVSGVCYCKKKKHVYCMTRKWHHAFIIFKRDEMNKKEPKREQTLEKRD